MLLFLSVIQILVAIFLVAIVLLQDAKGGGAFGMGGGGGSNQILSSTGTASFLTNLTWGLAIVFAATSIGLTYLTTSHSGSVTDNYVAPSSASHSVGPTKSSAAQPIAPKPKGPKK